MPKKDKKLIELRRKHVVEYVQDNPKKSISLIVDELSSKLFVSRATIYRDIKMYKE